MTSFAKNYTIRFAKEADLESLKIFFTKAYGKDSVFQEPGFLKWYFNQGLKRGGFMKSCLIASTNNDEIISYYGGLNYSLMLRGRPVSLVWGVNAYTLPEWRRMGINSKLVMGIANNCDVFGVIGMSLKTISFYQDLGFNVFNKQRFNRYVLNLDARTFKISKMISQDVHRAKKLFAVVSGDYHNEPLEKKGKIIQVNRKNIAKLAVSFDDKFYLTTHRDMNYLKWRFLNHPYIDYQLTAYISDNKILTYAAIRRERLFPTNYYASRIVDLYGNDNFIPGIIRAIALQAKTSNHIFVDFSAIGAKYRDTLTDLGFSRLENEDVALLPQVSSPIENRPNAEFIGLFSNKYKDEISKLTGEEVFFTRADSDRDRINKINQAKKGR